ncbi:MAG: tRNA (guanosine(46)-N7)-methyltransferase TrmB [Polyangiales bacterium]
MTSLPLSQPRVATPSPHPSEMSKETRIEPDPRRYVELAPRPPEGPIDVRGLWPDQPADADLELEIGFGRGMFLLERAEAAPESRILGLEIKRKWAYLVSERAERLGLTNLRVYGADARDVLARLTPDAALARMFMHFPDPWWKKRHAKRRLRGPGMFDPAARLLRPGGELFIQTDVEDRAATLLDDLQQHGAFEIPAGGYVQDNPYRARSNREKRAIADGLPVYRILVTRRA